MRMSVYSGIQIRNRESVVSIIRLSIIETALPLDRIHSLFGNATALVGAIGILILFKKIKSYYHRDIVALPVDLDDTDVAILKSLMEDGRKSFRAISREIKISTPTVKAHYERLVNMGLLKSVKPEIDLSKIDSHRKRQFFSEENIKQLSKQNKHLHVKVENLRVKMLCEYCGGPINSKPKVLEFANFQRFFCCIGCKNNYKEKHAGRIQSIVEHYREMKNDAKKLVH